MDDFVDKPEDYDYIIHGETRFVIFEKKESVSISFYYRMKNYWRITRKMTLQILSSIISFKKNDCD